VTNAPDRFVDLGALRIAVDERGAGDPPLVLVHGYTGSRLDFADVIDDLATDRRVIAWDHRGHADSTNLGDEASYTIGHLVADMERTLDDLGVTDLDLLGHSMGGIVAMRFTLAHPGRVRSLLLMDTLARPQAIPAEFMALMLDAARRDGMEGLADRMDELTTGTAPAIRTRNRYKLTHMDLEAFVGFGTELSTFASLLDRLPEIRCPTTVMVGANDVGLRASADEIAAAIPDAVPIVIADAAHSPQEEAPVAWLTAVRDHLGRAGR
jgi:pimeloyl-ACP methyl ester carboxylesterase